MKWSKEARAHIISGCYAQWGINNKKVLDVGCGDALVSEIISRDLNLDLHGTDILDYRKKDIKFKVMESPDRLPFESSSFDLVMLNDILHHTQNIEGLILEAKRVGGQILIFEDCESMFLKSIDLVLNYFYCRHMPCPLNFKTEYEWIELFKKLNLNYVSGKPEYPWWYPLRHMVFKLN
ncbi:MAG: class I SAM-dependent methyltransferase [Candidatus Omnitrophica bacterium]|nr:class I SAM-dependent methyltransferase [Candidatus Omnitrophota bacterium]MBU1869902.1 class I SAM-dependent methyltransferase [Candidatus Omnitrophota bacterium]